MSDFVTLIGSFDTATGALVASLGAYGAPVIFLSVVFFGETAIFISLLLALQGVLSLPVVFLCGALGTLCADIFWFVVGRFFPQRAISGTLKRIVLDPVHSFLERITKDRIFLSILFLKFFIGARLAIILYLARKPITFVRFLLYDTLGTLIYMILLTALATILGHFIKTVVPSFHIITSIATGFLLIFFISHTVRNMYAKSSDYRAHSMKSDFRSPRKDME